jgi:hypothetical protein
LAGLQFLRGRRQAGGAVQCMLQCAEQLQFNGLTQLVPKEVSRTHRHSSRTHWTMQKATFNTEMTELSLSAATLNDLQSMLRKVAYVNNKAHPTLGHRRVDVSASVQ